MIETFRAVTGIFTENTYFLVNKQEKWGIIVDPGHHSILHLEQLDLEEITWKAVFLTHAHFDHLLGLTELLKKIQPTVYLHKDDLLIYNEFKNNASEFGYNKAHLPPPNKFWVDREIIQIGSTKFGIIHTPGHTPGSVCIRWDNKLLTGDTLMYHSIGKTEKSSLPEQNKKSVFEKLFTLPGDTIIYPGHEKPSTIAKEIKYHTKSSLK